MRARLLDAALRVASVQGPARTSIDEVIEAADVSRGTFYKYFDSAERLIAALADEISSDLVRMVDPMMEAYPDPAVRVAVGMRIALSLVVQHRQLGGVLVQIGWPAVEEAHLYFEVVERDLRAGMQSGRFTKMPADVAMNLVAGSTVGGMNTMLRHGNPSYPAQAALTTLRALGISDEEGKKIVRLPLPLPQIGVDGIIGRALQAQAGRD